jgi:molybdopterin/thiamine biosynthesis adenylyltransferase
LYSKRSTRPLADASVLIVGTGALGCAAAEALARAGIGRLVLVDPDLVELSNLQRKVLFTDADIGRPKVEVAAERLRAMAADLSVDVATIRLDAANACDLLADCDYAIDGSDDPATKFLTNEAALATGTAWCHGGVVQSGGQWMHVEPGAGACLECVFERSPADDGASPASCAAMGILAPVAGVVGNAQALAAAAWLVGRPAVAGRLHTYELRGRQRRAIDFPRLTGCRCQSSRVRGTDPYPRRQQPCPL